MKKHSPKKPHKKVGKHKKMKSQKGFTMIELILVIAVLGILSAVALPSFYDFTASARASARDGVIGGVRSGVNMYRSNQLATGASPIVPATLDSAADGACNAANACFGGVMQDPINDGKWTRASSGASYTWDGDGDGTADMTCAFDSTTGSFTCT